MKVQEDLKMDITQAVEVIRETCSDVREGLPEEVFLLISALVPIPNVDLLITDENDRILLSWRNDSYFGTGWHIPGGCIRYGETMLQRIQKTALKELGCEVEVDLRPLAIRDVICEPRENLKNKDERGHHIAVLYHCKLPKGYQIDNGGRTAHEAGYLQWFSKLPDNLLSVHDVYSDVLIKWK